MTKIEWKVKRVRAAELDSLAERHALRRAPEGTVLSLVESKDGVSGLELLRMCVVLRPKRTSGLNSLRMIGAFSVAHGVRKTTGIVAWLKPPGKVVVEDSVIGNAFSIVKHERGPRSYVLLLASVHCRIESRQLGDLLTDSPWPENTVFVNPWILQEKILESLEWVYSEWERGMDETLRSRLEPISGEFLP